MPQLGELYPYFYITEIVKNRFHILECYINYPFNCWDATLAICVSTGKWNNGFLIFPILCVTFQLSLSEVCQTLLVNSLKTSILHSSGSLETMTDAHSQPPNLKEVSRLTQKVSSPTFVKDNFLFTLKEMVPTSFLLSFSSLPFSNIPLLAHIII